eukprot:Skav232535  [mRNA]  locus=scaffold319:109502:111740:+ [translate_table: standard]
MLLPLILHLVAGAQFPDVECEATSQLQSHQVLKAQAQRETCRTCSDDVCCKGGSCRGSSFSNVRSISCTGTRTHSSRTCWNMPLAEVSRDMHCGLGACARSIFQFTGTNDHCMSCVGPRGSCFDAEFNLLAPATGQTVTLNALCVDLGTCALGHWIVAPSTKLRILCKDGACSRGTVTLGAGSALDLTCNAGTDPETCQQFQVIKGSGATCKLTKVGSFLNTIDVTAACQDTEAVAAPDECMENGVDADQNTACCATYGCGAPECLSAEVSEGNKVSVDWQIFSHYSGSQSFTKGLLLVDKSGGSVKQVLELTAQDCEWKARSQKDEWKAVSDEAFAIPHTGTEWLVSKKSGAKGHNHVHMKLKMQKGETEVADSWGNLGGSEQAALYLEMNQEMVDMSFLSMPCTSEAEDVAKKTCSKHLLDMEKDHPVFQDCVFDLCHGADETVAELAAELRDSTRAI